MAEDESPTYLVPAGDNFGRVDAILPAGGRISGDFAREAGAENKALIRLNGQTLLATALRALQSSDRVGTIVVIGDAEVRAEAVSLGADGALAEGATGPDNILRGLSWLQEQRKSQGTSASRVLVVNTDLPFLTSEALQRFLRNCPPDADVCVPITPAEAFQARFPGSINTYLPLRDGGVTMGCVFLVNPTTLLQNRAHIESLFAARKNHWKIAWMVGASITLRLLTRRLSVEDIVARASRIARCRGAAVCDAPPELAFDIDTLDEFRYAAQHVTASPSLTTRIGTQERLA